MNKNMVLIFGILALLFVMQSVGGYFQIQAYRKAIRRVAEHGTVGIGQKRGGFLSGYLVLAACDQDGIITHCEVMDGITFMARFHEKKELLGIPLVGSSVDEYMRIFHSLDKRSFKRNKGYIQAIDALCKRLYPERYTEEELHTITVKQP